MAKRMSAARASAAPRLRAREVEIDIAEAAPSGKKTAEVDPMAEMVPSSESFSFS